MNEHDIWYEAWQAAGKARALAETLTNREVQSGLEALAEMLRDAAAAEALAAS
ncbi:MAG: hypothetical protein LBQ92_05785 [Propionibacteriaceae bacterium]|jgi:hypothetical protein|nr:hypothetical protein [Propionibacteriaceae bacterium]